MKALKQLFCDVKTQSVGTVMSSWCPKTTRKQCNTFSDICNVPTHVTTITFRALEISKQAGMKVIVNTPLKTEIPR